MPRLFASFPFRRALLAPLSLAYLAGATLHRALWLRPSRAPAPAVPLWVIGSLRAGGAGKTAVTLELARRLVASGKRVGILAYRIGGSSGIFSRDDIHEILPGSDWRESSDEAVLLARESGARVFATRRRDRAWRSLAATGDFDLLLSDDGLMDGRLSGAVRIALARPGERPGWRDLLPGGPFRLTAAALSRVDHVWRGPLEAEAGDLADAARDRGGNGSQDPAPEPTPNPAAAFPKASPETSPQGAAKSSAHAGAPQGFRREPVLPPGLDLAKTYWALCGLGDPRAFRRALERAGVRLAGLSAGPDHGLPNLEKARRSARRAGAAGFLYSAKDAIKLEARLRPGESAGRIGERVRFVPDSPPLPGAPWSLPSS